ncbi:hypothetical protein [Absidia glauca]|uniref:Uncharacterized protein n=1 Tax=Absidia glauca TaxID=4829 RepID=A0A168Q809_ABSGL|nr:hypothetical protein [Absidia glauca]
MLVCNARIAHYACMVVGFEKYMPTWIRADGRCTVLYIVIELSIFCALWEFEMPPAQYVAPPLLTFFSLQPSKTNSRRLLLYLILKSFATTSAAAM